MIASGNAFRSAAQRRSVTSFSRRQLTVQANWGAPVDFKTAKVSSRTVVSPDLRLIHVDVGPSIAAGYTLPGQYVQVKASDADKAGFMAIASAPSASKAGILELLIKVVPGSAAEKVTNLSEGDDVLVGPVEGKGFNIGSIPDASTIVLVATGTGISPIKAVIESGVLSSANLHLYYGTKGKDVSAYQDLVPKWEAAGVKVTQVFSGENQHYVQNVIKADVDAGKLIPSGGAKSVGVLMCGQKDMCNAVKETLIAAGVDPAAILLNF